MSFNTSNIACGSKSCEEHRRRSVISQRNENILTIWQNNGREPNETNPESVFDTCSWVTQDTADIEVSINSEKIASMRDFKLSQVRDNIYITNFEMNLNQGDIEELENIINELSPENILPIIRQYLKNGYDEVIENDLLTKIMHSSDIDINTRIKILEAIVDKVLEFYTIEGIPTEDLRGRFYNELDFLKQAGLEQNNSDYLQIFLFELEARILKDLNLEKIHFDDVDINGAIDSAFCQGTTGDCWLLASIIAINNSPKGHQILEESLTINEDGSVTVVLKGVDKTYTITREEIENNMHLANGDLDIRAIEIAINKYFYEERGVDGRLDINGNNMHIAYQILLGNEYPINTHKLSLVDRFSPNDYDSPNLITTVGSTKVGTHYGLTSSGEKIELHGGHAYAVVGSDKNSIQIINPWESNTIISITKSGFYNFFDFCEQIRL